MEKNNQNNTPNTVPQPPQAVTPQPPASPEAPVAHKISPKESIKIRISEIKHMLGLDDPAKKKKMIIIILVVAILFILITVGYALIPRQVASPLATLTPTPIGTEQPRGEPSEYADDPEILRIMDAIQAFDVEADSTVLREEDLRLPTVDWNISF